MRLRNVSGYRIFIPILFLYLTETEATRQTESPFSFSFLQTFASMDLPENLTEVMMDEQKKENSNQTLNAAATTNTNKAAAPSKKQQPSSKRHFMLSGISEEDRTTFIAFLAKHKVACSNTSGCDPDATHIVAQKLSRTEKMLGSIASGKWVLHPSYIDACLAADKVLGEESFEWGNPKNPFLERLTPDSLEDNFAKASFRWRQVVQSGEKEGAFSGIQAILHTSGSRKESFGRLLQLGKGRVVDVDAPYTDCEGATHCLAELNRLPKVKMDFKSLAANGVAVVGPLYLNAFVVSDPPPKVDSFLLPEFKQYWSQRRA